MKIITSLLALSLALVGGLACDEVNEVAPALRITGQVVPDDSCVVKTTGGAQQEFKSRGILDLAVGATYMGYLMVQNDFPQFDSLTGASPEQGLVDPSSVNITHLDVTLRLDEALIIGSPAFQARYQELFNAGIALPFSYTVPGATSIAATSGGAILAPIIPQNMGLAFRSLQQIADGDSVEVIADIRVVGNRQDGLKIQSGIFSFPITLCNHCLVQDRFELEVALNPFAEENKLTEQDIGHFCEPGQDNFITNAICGVLFPNQNPEDCHVARCLGLEGAALFCPDDSKVFEVP